jgi:2'-5' RNA ligase
MRLFTGLAIPDRIASRITWAIEELRPTADLRWSNPANLHITTKFIGAWPEEKLPELQRTLAALEPTARFEVTVSHFGFWPNPHQPSIFFAAVQPSTELQTLARRIGEALSVLGCEPEKNTYSPHITLARVKRANIGALREKVAAMANMNNFDFGSFAPQEFFLYSSTPSPEGSVYTKLSGFSLIRSGPEAGQASETGRASETGQA